jgi:hypothetical protein
MFYSVDSALGSSTLVCQCIFLTCTQAEHEQARRHDTRLLSCFLRVHMLPATLS